MAWNSSKDFRVGRYWAAFSRHLLFMMPVLPAKRLASKALHHLEALDSRLSGTYERVHFSILIRWVGAEIWSSLLVH